MKVDESRTIAVEFVANVNSKLPWDFSAEKTRIEVHPGALTEVWFDATNQSGSFTLDKQEQPLWQAAGMAADHGGTLDIVATVSVAIAATGLLGANVEYVDNGN